MSANDMTKKIAQILSKIDGLAVSELMAVCPYRTFIAPGPLASIGTEVMAEHAGGVFPLLELEPTAIDPAPMAEIQATLLAGKTVLLLARTNEVRNHARREILAWYDAAKGVIQ